MSLQEAPKRSLEAQELFDNWTVSASGLSEFSKSPLAFKAYKEAESSEDSDHFKLGTAIHCRVLESEEFDNRYYVMEVEPPGAETNMRIFIDRYFYYITNDFDPILAKDMAYKDSGYKTKLETVWKNFEEKESYVEYWNALVDSEDKIVLSSKEELLIENCAKSIFNHKIADSFLDMSPKDDIQYLTECEILWEMKGFDFKMKSIIDRMIINTKDKLINIIDIKTTSKNVHKFQYSYKSFATYRQLAFYGHAVMWYIENVLKEDRKDWSLTTTIIAVQTTGFNETVVYAPDPNDMMIGHREIIDLLTELNWHYENNLWEYPVNYYLSGGIVPIALDLDKYDVTREEGNVQETEGNTNN